MIFNIDFNYIKKQAASCGINTTENKVKLLIETSDMQQRIWNVIEEEVQYLLTENEE